MKVNEGQQIMMLLYRLAESLKLRLSGCLRRVAIDHVLIETPPRQDEEKGTGRIETRGNEHG